MKGLTGVTEKAQGELAEYIQNIIRGHDPDAIEKREPPAQVEKESEFYSNKLLDEVTKVNMGFPL